MAYELYYTAHFTNEQSQETLVSIYKKDAAAPAEVENYELTQCETVDSGEEQSPFNCIIIRELIMSLDTRDSQTISWETFVESEHDTWLIIATIEGQYYFHGFITPDEGRGPFQDKPYDVTISAINGLALLKNVPLSDVNGDDFDGDHPLIDYIAGALKKTLLDLNIRVYCGYFHASMQNKGNSLNDDMFQQTELNYRTFMSDATTFVSCYDALKIILNRFCTLEYWNGLWLIATIGEKQYLPSDNRYYVEYSDDGVVLGGSIDTSNYGQIGKSVDIYPINETQSISSKSGVKRVKTTYEFISWPELPKNNKFDRGTEFETGVATDEDDLDNDGDTSEVIGTYKKFNIQDWEFGKILSPIPANFPFPLTTPDGDAYVKRVYNNFNVEIQRKVVIETPSSGFHWLRSEPIPVKRDSKIKIGLQKKFAADFTSGSPTATTAAYVYISDPGETQFWGLSTASPGGSIPEGLWKLNSLSQLVIEYAEDQDSRKYAGFNIQSLSIPSDGNLYIVFNCGTGSVGATQDYADFTFEYMPFVAGGYIQVKGDYIVRTNAANFLQVIDEKVSISDSPQRVFKGALLFNNQLTDPAWYRHGPVTDPIVLDESKHFKELLNIARYNFHYRRMYNLEGDFNGLNWAPENDQLNKQPIGFHWMYREVDMTVPRDFVLIPPLKMDLIKGWIAANLIEVKRDSSDGAEEGTAEYKYQF